jgi:hypothetical protein
MNKNENILLLVGSPKNSSSTSASLGDYLTLRLEELGGSVEKEYLYKLIRKDEGQKKILSMVDNSDLIILAFPLYVDCLPTGVIETLELIANHRKSLNNPKKIGFVVIINCGFPEAEQNNTAIAICKIFVREVGFEWKGALSLGMGGAIGGIPLEERGGMVRNLKKGINIAAQALAEGKNIPEEAIELVAKRFIPISLYTKMGNSGWKKQAKKFGVREIIEAKPYI